MENFIIANCTDTGKVRNVNEDSMAAFDTPNGYVVVVCDGMGGQNAGDVASQLAVTVINDILTDNKFSTPQEAITSSIIAANKAILMQASRNPELEGMGSTCVMAIIKDGMVYYGSVGDSRIYYMSSNMIRQITKDQSYVQTLVDAGEITPMMAEHHADKNQITNALGIESMTPPVVSEVPITPEPDSIFLLCSDGVSGMINNQTIVTTLSDESLTLQERAELLVKQANDAGGNDNITVQLISFPSSNTKTQAKQSGTAVRSKARKKKGGNGMLTTIILVALILIAAAGAAWYFLAKPDANTAAPIPTKQVEKQKVQNKPKASSNVNKTETTRVVIENAPSKKEKKQDYKESILKKQKKNQPGKPGSGDAKIKSEKDIIEGTRVEDIKDK